MKGIVFEGSFIIVIMSPMVCYKLFSVVVFGKANAYIGGYLGFLLFQLRACNTAYIFSGQVMEKYTTPVCHDGTMMCGCQVCHVLSRGFQVVPSEIY